MEEQCFTARSLICGIIVSQCFLKQTYNKIKQFPLKLAWGSTGHKVQGITIKKGTNVVIHGHERIPDGMYYLMLSRAQEMQQIYIEMPKLKNKSEKLKLKIRANSHSLKENENLVQRSIVSFYKENYFSVFMVNIGSLQKRSQSSLMTFMLKSLITSA